MTSYEKTHYYEILKRLQSPSIWTIRKSVMSGVGTGMAPAPGGVLTDQSPEKPRQTTNYIRIQQRPTEDFKDGQFKTIEYGEKIKAVYGRVGGSGNKNPGKWAIQTLLFPKDKYNKDSATQWARTHGFKVGTGGVQPGHVLADAGMGMGGQPMAQPQPAQPKMDGMPGYLGGAAPVQAQGAKAWKPNADGWRTGEPYAYNQLTGEWEATEKAHSIDLEKGLEVAIGGIAGTPGIFCDWCRIATGSYKKYGDFKLCSKCYSHSERARFQK